MTIEKDGNGDPTGVFFEEEFPPIAELIWFRDAARFTAADRLRTLPESAKAYHSFGTTSIFEGHGVANELLRVYKQAHRDGTLTMRSTLAFSANWTAAGDAPLGPFVEAWLGWLGEPGLGDDMLKMSGLYRSHRPHEADNARARGGAVHRLGRLQLQPRPAARPGQGTAAALRARTTSARPASPAAPATKCSISTKRSTGNPVKGRRWVMSHINVISPARHATAS